MNSQLNSQPMNWAIDYSQNKAGQIYGNAISNIGGMTGNAIMEFAKKQREDAEKKAKEEAAQKFLTAQGMPEEDAKGVVKGIGVDNFLKMQQIDNERKQMQMQAQAYPQRVAQAEAEAKAEKAKTEAAARDAAIYKNVLMGGSAPGTPPPMLARNGSTQADMSPMGYMQRMAQSGASMEAINKGGDAIRQAQGTPEAKMKTHDVDGRKITTFGNQIVYEPKETQARGLKIGDTDIREINGVKTELEWQGSRNGWVRKSDQQPLMIPASPFDFTGSPRQNPTVWGTKQADEPPAEQIGGAVSVKTKAEYDALPVGTSYIGPDGKRATKKAR